MLGILSSNTMMTDNKRVPLQMELMKAISHETPPVFLNLNYHNSYEHYFSHNVMCNKSLASPHSKELIFLK